MAPCQEQQLEKIIDEALKSRNLQALDVFLQEDIHEGTTIKCSKQFLIKLDKLVIRSLDQKNAKSASLGLTVLCKCGKNLSLPGGQGLPGIIAQGLVKKKCRQLWLQGGPQRDEALLNLSEDFFDSLMVIHEACKEGTYEVTESLLYPIGQLAADPRIYVLIQKEAIRKFNSILDKIPAELKKEKKILSSQEASDVMVKLAGRILDGGDYDLQTALMESLCRMTTPIQRKELAGHWFSMEYVAKAFVKIRDSEFETDCRKFLNLVNGMQGDKRRVYSYPCLEVFMDKHEMLMPPDEKLEEFWIDFNLGSQSISFYFSLSDEEEGQWDTMCISDNEVQSYTVTEEGKRHVLRLKLLELVSVGVVEGSSLTIHFSSSLDILQAARRVFGHSKEKSFVGKSSMSVVKTTVKIIMEESNSQAVVPESQVSPRENERNSAPYCLPPPSASLQIVTPAKSRISESSTFITSSAGGSVHGASPFSVMPSRTPSKGKGKAPLEMVHSCDRQGEKYLGKQGTSAKASSRGINPNSSVTGGVIEQSDTSKQATRNMVEKHRKNIPLKKAVAMVLAEQGEEAEPLDQSFVPDSQPTMKTERSIYSHWNKLSVSEMLMMMPTQKINSLPRTEPSPNLEQQKEHPSSASRVSVPGSGPISHKQFHAELTQRLQEILNERNHLAPQDTVGFKEKRSEVREDSQGRGSADQRRSTWQTPKEPQKQQAQSKGLVRGNNKGQKSVEADPAPVKTPTKAIASKVLQERITPNVKVTATRPLSSKEKRDAEVAGSMVKFISSHYKSNTYSTAKATADNIPPSLIPPPVNKSIFDKSWLSAAKKEESRDSGKLNSHNKLRKNSLLQRGDIFEFQVDTPFRIEGKGKMITESSTLSSSGIHDSWTLPSTTKNGQSVAKQAKRHVKKHLFSDTDTDCAMTEVSWLKESGRKPKPKVTKYSRQPPPKPKPIPPDTTYESPDLPPSSPKPGKGKTKPNKRPWEKEAVKQPEKTVRPAAASNRPPAAGRRPQRAAATTTKSYKEPDTDDSQSESEKPPASKSKYISVDQLQKTENTCHEAAQVKKKQPAPGKEPTKTYRKLESSESETEQPPAPKKYLVGQQGKNEKTCQEAAEQNTQKTHQLNRKKIPAKEQMTVPKDSWAGCLVSRSPSPPAIERMRSAERSAPILVMTCSPLLSPRGSPLPASPTHPCQGTPSPVLQLLKPPHSTFSSKGNFQSSSFCSGEIKCSKLKTLSLQSPPSPPSLTDPGQTPAPCAARRPGAAEMSPVQQPLPSAPQSPLSLSLQPLLTSTALELDKVSMASPPQSQTTHDTLNHGLQYGSSKVSPVSQMSLSHSSTKSLALTSMKDKPTAGLARKMEKTPSSDRKLKHPLHNNLGPSHKRHISHPSSEDSDEEEKEERKKSKRLGQHPARMRPRKLFKSSVEPHGQAWGQQSSLTEERKESKPKGSTVKANTKSYQSIKNKSITQTTCGTVIEVSPEGEVSRMTSSRTVSSSRWEAEVDDEDADADEDVELPDITVKHGDMGSMCRQFSSELQRKFQNRHRLMEVYSKQSLKTVQQHVSSLSTQVNKYRTQRLEQIREVLMEEIRSLEEDDNILNNMEKDLTIYWKKQSMAFRSYQEKESRRFEALKSTFQDNVCHSLEYEERIFTSQMCLMRKDMKSVQDRLLNEMREEEMHSVRRGLQALFLPEGARF